MYDFLNFIKNLNYFFSSLGNIFELLCGVIIMFVVFVYLLFLSLCVHVIVKNHICDES